MSQVLIKNCIWGGLFFLTACSNLSSLDQQIKRLNEKEGISSIRPEFPLSPTNFGSPQISKSVVAGNQQEERPYRHYSNKKLYFTLLWQQYESLKSFAYGGTPLQKVESCPNFHSTLVEAKTASGHPVRMVPVEGHSVVKSQLIQEQLALYPELSLPATLEKARPQVWEMAANKKKKMTVSKMLAQALNNHLQRNYIELQELCHYGQSSNYYVFENLINYNQEHQEFRNSPSSLQSLLKTPVYSNLLLLFSLQLEFIPEKTSTETLFSSKLSQELMERLDAKWSMLYFKELERKRMELKAAKSSFISSRPRA